MKKYLGFECGGFQFLLDVASVVEVFDAFASPEDLSKVLVGDSTEVYWRSQLAKKVHLAGLLESASHESSCYVVCRSEMSAGGLRILQVDAIHAIHEIDENSFSPLRINNSRLNAISEQVYLSEESDSLVFVLKDVEGFFRDFTPG